MTEQDPKDDDMWAMPSAQCICRGEEIADGIKAVVAGFFGQDVQRICPRDDHIIAASPRPMLPQQLPGAH